MKVYEIRDITDDEVYQTVKYCATANEAISELQRIAQDVNDSPTDYDFVRGAVFEHEVGVFRHKKGFEVRIFEMTFRQEYFESLDEYKWHGEVTFSRESGPTAREDGGK